MNHPHERYVFWVYDFAIPFYRHLVKPFADPALCEIDDAKLLTTEHKSPQIQLEDISILQCTLGGGSRNSEYVVQMVFRNEKGLGLYPMNPLTPDQWLEARHEAEAMVAVIEAFRQGRTPDLDPNPYHRELKQQGREDEISRRVWDPYVSPWVYYRQDHPRPSLSNILLLTVATLLALAIGVALLVFLLETLSGGSL